MAAELAIELNGGKDSDPGPILHCDEAADQLQIRRVQIKRPNFEPESFEQGTSYE
jgi:hypothetical protein